MVRLSPTYARWWSRLWCGVLSGGLLYLSLARSSQAQITLDGSLGPRGPLTGPNYAIPATMGQIRGPNLFHSFGQFNIQKGESATFSGPPSISNILSRVTGGQPSTIDGVLRSQIPRAHLYLLNPSGVLFGPNATLDVQGSFHVSTADYLRLADGTCFVARLSDTTTLSVAPPAAFGFLDRPPPRLPSRAVSYSSLQEKPCLWSDHYPHRFSTRLATRQPSTSNVKSRKPRHKVRTPGIPSL